MQTLPDDCYACMLRNNISFDMDLHAFCSLPNVASSLGCSPLRRGLVHTVWSCANYIFHKKLNALPWSYAEDYTNQEYGAFFVELLIMHQYNNLQKEKSFHTKFSILERFNQHLVGVKVSKCDPLSENPALHANIEFELKAILSVQVVFQLNSDYRTKVVITGGLPCIILNYVQLFFCL